MPVVKGGVWTNIEDEILKASVSKYGLNQWARVSSLLARKTAKQCKARWTEWLDPSIKKIEWSREEDEKLLHLAKILSTQWRTIAPVVGRTANQCLERYNKLLDEAEARDAADLGLAGPQGGETLAVSGGNTRRLRPGEHDPNPEAKPAKPDTVDLDEDEKEMLSEARARLANTQGKKAKRKARERQQEESRRLANLQKRRELKTAGINIKIVTRKPGQMDYNADIPFEKKPALGFYDTAEEQSRNEFQRANFDPRKLQVASKRKGDGDEDNDRKRRKNDKDAPSASHQAAVEAGKMQRIREAEQSSKRRALVLPAPQVSDGELDNIVKMGRMGEQANVRAKDSENDATRSLVTSYSNLNTNAPIRTPMAPPQEDHIANEIRDIRASSQTQSALLGGDNLEQYQVQGTTGYEGMTPRRHVVSTPNPLATPLRTGGGLSSHGPTPMRPDQTPIRTPRDAFALNNEGAMLPPGATPRDARMAELSLRNRLKHGLASLPRPKQLDFELAAPEDQEETVTVDDVTEDAGERDRKAQLAREAQEALERKRRTQVMQRGDLPRPNAREILEHASKLKTEEAKVIFREAALLVLSDASNFPLSGSKPAGKSVPLENYSDESLQEARDLITFEAGPPPDPDAVHRAFEARDADSVLMGLGGYGDDDGSPAVAVMMTSVFNSVREEILSIAQDNIKAETKLDRHLGGFMKRKTMLDKKIGEAHKALQEATFALNGFKTLASSEHVAIQRRLEGLRDEVGLVSRREREAQELYRKTKEELEALSLGGVNGVH